MLYHDDPDWYQKPGQTVEVPLGPAVSATRHTVRVPWKAGRYDDVEADHDAALFGRRVIDEACYASVEELKATFAPVQHLLRRHFPRLDHNYVQRMCRSCVRPYAVGSDDPDACPHCGSALTYDPLAMPSSQLTDPQLPIDQLSSPHAEDERDASPAQDEPT
jgi:hypothetical protein